MAAKAKEALKKLPGFSIGVRKGAALRDVTLAQPICPNSQIRGKIVNGQYEAPDIQPGMENCQLMGEGWWEYCEAQGHHPYYSTRRIYTTTDVVEEDPSTGELVVTGQRRTVREVEVLNVTQVSPSIQHNSGMGVYRKMKRRGYKRLEDLGYEEVCQYRGCQKPVEYRAQGLGDYCSLEHLNLIAARESEEFLTKAAEETAGLGQGVERAIEKRRREQLQKVLPRDVEKL